MEVYHWIVSELDWTAAGLVGLTSSGGYGNRVFAGNAPCSNNPNIVVNWRRTTVYAPSLFDNQNDCQTCPGRSFVPEVVVGVLLHLDLWIMFHFVFDNICFPPSESCVGGHCPHCEGWRHLPWGSELFSFFSGRTRDRNVRPSASKISFGSVRTEDLVVCPRGRRMLPCDVDIVSFIWG